MRANTRAAVLLLMTFLIGCASKPDAPAIASRPQEEVDDETAAIQTELDTVGRAGGGIVQLPRGNFRCKGQLNVPAGVTLQGIWTSVPSHNGIRDPGLPKPTDDGTTLLVTGGVGSEEGTPFITLNSNSTLKGVCIFYPDQTTDDVPTPYPYAIAMRGKNPAVLDVELLNPYNGIDASRNERHLIRNVSGQPIRRGIYVDNVVDVGRIENVHFNPWFSHRTKLFQWQQENGEAFVFGRADWEYVLNTFCFGYKIGYRFIQTPAGVCNGNFLGIGGDECYTSLQVDDCAHFGVMITNGEFVSFTGPDPTMIRVSETNKGTVKFANCAFWGPCNQIAKIAGEGVVGFSDCTFAAWGDKAKTIPAIQTDGATLLVRGCSFHLDQPQVRLGANVRSAIVSENVITGAERVENLSSGKVVVKDNVSGK